MCRHCLEQVLTLTTTYWLRRWKKIIRFQKQKPRWDLAKLYAQRQKVHDSLEEKLGAIKCESGNVEVHWNNIKKCVLDTMSDLVW
jgi:hypothetical protein